MPDEKILAVYEQVRNRYSFFDYWKKTIERDQIVNSNVLSDYLMMGELSLNGALQPIKGVLAMAIYEKEAGLSIKDLKEINRRGIKVILINNLFQFK